MKIRMLVVGETAPGFHHDGINFYANRLRHYFPFEIVELKDVKNLRGKTEAQQKELEGKLLLSQFAAGDTVILLDENGKEFTSRQFADFLERKIAAVNRDIWFVIGGPYGFSDVVYSRADGKIALSRMTFTHEMARLFFVEQLYRAGTILRSEPYHHD